MTLRELIHSRRDSPKRILSKIDETVVYTDESSNERIYSLSMDAEL